MRSARASSSGSGAMSPSMLNTASVAISLRRAVDAASRARSAATSRCAIADEFGARQQRAVVQARVVQPVGEDRVVAPRERGQDREIGKIAGRECQRARAVARRDEGGELLLERGVRRAVPADEVRRARADAPARCASRAAATTRGIVGEPEVIVAGEREQLAAVDDDARALRATERAPPSRARESVGSAALAKRRRRSACESARIVRSARGRRSRGCAIARHEAELAEQRAVGLDVGIAGGQQLVAVEDRIGAGEEAQRLHGLAELARARRTAAPSRCGIVMRATAIVRTNSSGSSAASPPNRACSGVPSTCTR